MELNSRNIKKIIFIIFCGAIIFAVTQNALMFFRLISKVIGVFSPIILALCVAFVLNILLTALETKVFKFMDKSPKKVVHKIKRPLCLVLTYLIALGIVSLLILVIIPDIVDTVTYLAQKLPSFVKQFRGFITDILLKFNFKDINLPDLDVNWSAVSKNIISMVSGSSGKIVDGAVNITSSVFSGVFDTVFSFVISVYILSQKEKIGNFSKRVLEAFLPQRVTGIIYHVCAQTNSSFSKFTGGQLTEALILGTLCFIGMSIFGFPNALIISVIICVTALVPIVGATIGTIIGFLLIVITSPIKALLFVAFLLVLQQIEGNLIYPKVVGKAVGLPGVIVVSAVLVGGNIGGVLGALIAVPTCAVIYTLLREVVDYMHAKKQAEVQPQINEKETETETE